MAAGTQIAVTFDEAFATVPRIALTAVNRDALDLPVYVEKTVNCFELKTKIALEAGKTYQFDYIVIQ